MPLPTPNKGEERDDFVSRCMSNDTMKSEFPDQKQRLAVCFSQWRKSGTKGVRGGDRGGSHSRPLKGESMKKIINEKFKFSTPFVVEDVDKETSKDKIKIRGTMIKAKTSRNGRTYLIEELRNALFTGNTISVGHTDNPTDNVGFFKPIPTSDGLDFEGVVMNTPYHPGIVEMIRKGLIKFVSVEAIAKELEEDTSGNRVVRGLDFTGLGLVKTPGFPEATLAIAEAFEKNEGEKMENENWDEEDVAECLADLLTDEELLDALEEKAFPGKLGTGQRFAACVRRVMGRKNPRTGKNYTEDEARAICATIGRKKYGKAKFQALAKKGKESVGDKTMEEENKPKEEVKNEEKQETNQVVEEIKKLSEKIDKTEELAKRVEELEKKLSEKKETKGIVTEAENKPKPRFNLVKEKNSYRPGTVDIYTDEVVY